MDTIYLELCLVGGQIVLPSVRWYSNLEEVLDRIKELSVERVGDPKYRFYEVVKKSEPRLHTLADITGG